MPASSGRIAHRKTAYHHGDLREALISAALAMLEEGADPAGFSLREAARRAGVSAMAPYRHFPDKESLLSALATIGFERLAAATGRADAESSTPTAQLEAQGKAYVAFAVANPALFRLMFGAKAPSKTGALQAAAARAFGILADRVASQSPPEASLDRALAAWSLVHGLAMLAVDGQLHLFGADPLATADRIVACWIGERGGPIALGADQKAIGEPSQAKKPPVSPGARRSTTSTR